MPMMNPSHPGRIVQSECLEPLGLTVTAGAEILDVTRRTLSEIVNEKRGISAEMAIRLEKAFGGKADAWMRMQAAYDLAQAMKRVDKINVHRFTGPAPAHV